MEKTDEKTGDVKKTEKLKMSGCVVMALFANQIERHMPCKVVLTPTSIKERGVVCKVSFLKTYTNSAPKAGLKTKTCRFRVCVCGTAENLTGLRLAVEAIEALDDYMTGKFGVLRLEDKNGKPIANTRISQFISEEDSFMDSPDSTEVQDVQDERIVTVNFLSE